MRGDTSVGADRKGPLAAFVVIAIIAAVLLVTSVRSQAAPGWLDPDKLPASVVAAPGAEPHLWSAVTGGVDQVVQDGVVLARKATSAATAGQDTTTAAIGASTSVASTTTSSDAVRPARHHAVRAHRVVSHPHAATPASPHRPTRPDGEQPSAEPPAAPTSPATDPDVEPSVPAAHDHGRHLGWSHGRGHADDADPSEPNGSEHGQGQGHGHGGGHDHGHEHGQGHGHGHDGDESS